MGADQSIMHYFWAASPVVKSVMLLLLALSIASWTIIFQRGFFLRKAKQACEQFERLFWETDNLQGLYLTLQEKSKNNMNKSNGLQPIFQAGFKELLRFSKLQNQSTSRIFEAVYRAMRIACARESETFSHNLTFLATVGSTTPYIGLFGTVWGIMSSFHALGGAQQQVTLAMVAPGISEALIATAMGLFAAIPAVIAYNRYNHRVETLIGNMENFQEEFTGLLTYQIQEQQQGS